MTERHYDSRVLKNVETPRVRSTDLQKVVCEVIGNVPYAGI